MRIALIVLLTISVLAGVLAGGGLSFTLTAGPKSGDIKKASELVSEMKKVAKDDAPMLVMLEKGIRGLRVIQFGGAALVIADIALLILVLKRRSRGVAVASAACVAIAIASFALRAPKDIDESAFLLANVLGGLALAAAVLALAADRVGRPASAVAAPAAALR